MGRSSSFNFLWSQSGCAAPTQNIPHSASAKSQSCQLLMDQLMIKQYGGRLPKRSIKSWQEIESSNTLKDSKQFYNPSCTLEITCRKRGWEQCLCWDQITARAKEAVTHVNLVQMPLFFPRAQWLHFLSSTLCYFYHFLTYPLSCSIRN